MTESADIKIAADRLQRALRSLEESLEPMVQKISSLEKEAAESGDFQSDRAELASQLDAAAAKEKQYQAREAEFAALAEETTEELDRVIRQVKHVLEGDT